MRMKSNTTEGAGSEKKVNPVDFVVGIAVLAFLALFLFMVRKCCGAPKTGRRARKKATSAAIPLKARPRPRPASAARPSDLTESSSPDPNHRVPGAGTENQGHVAEVYMSGALGDGDSPARASDDEDDRGAGSSRVNSRDPDLGVDEQGVLDHPKGILKQGTSTKIAYAEGKKLTFVPE